MKKLLLFLLCLILLGYYGRPATAADSSSLQWKIVAQDKWVKVSAEKNLYKQANSYLVHFRIDNLSANKIGFEAKSLFTSRHEFYSQKADPPVAFDYKTGPRHLPTASEKQILLQKFNAADQVLIMLSAGASFDYYAAFDRTRIQDKEAGNARYVVALVDGKMAFTDGKTVSIVQPLGFPLAESARIPLPSGWREGDTDDHPECWTEVSLPLLWTMPPPPGGAKIYP